MTWPSATLEILKVLRQIIQAIDLHSKRLVQLHGVTVPQLLVLQALRHDMERNAGDLARDVHLSQGTMTDLMIRLEKRHLVQRVKSEADRRRITVQLTDEGKTVVDQAPPLLHDSFLEELDKLKEWERNQILATLQRVAQMMRADKVEAAPVLVADAFATGGDEVDSIMPDPQPSPRA